LRTTSAKNREVLRPNSAIAPADRPRRPLSERQAEIVQTLSDAIQKVLSEGYCIDDLVDGHIRTAAPQRIE
jgi:hypothetical protein